MCGIAGVLDHAARPVSEELVRRMISRIRYRGPDDTGVYVEGGLGFGHARLSIIDIAGGHQPMSIGDGAYWITYNGEVFNYLELREELESRGCRFRTKSDTEVILHLFREEGESCVERLNGQWAFAIWDRDRRRLFLSRDRLGIRPLFYAEAPGSFVFASELAALVPAPGFDPRLDLRALDEIFTFWTTRPPRSILEGVSELPPGHSLVVESGRVRSYRYWKPEYEPLASPDAATGERLLGELGELLRDATRLRLRADVPVGAYLSGGLDSTLIASLAREEAGDRLRTFSVAFEDRDLDESCFQREATEFLGTENSRVVCAGADIERVFRDVVRHVGQPVLRTAPAPLYLLSRHVRESGCKVVLTGEGADEMFGGYDIFKEAKIRRFWGVCPDSAWRPLLLGRLYPYMPDIQRQPAAYLKRFWDIGSGEMDSPFFSHLPRWRLTSKIKEFLSPEVRAATMGFDAIGDLGGALPADYGSWGPFGQAEYLESTLLLPGYILSSQGDRVAMAHGVEARYPFLDHRVVEFAGRLPARLKMKVLEEKHLLRRLAEGRIPESVRVRPKQPYRAPDGSSFFGPHATLVDEMLAPERVRAGGLFDADRVAGLVGKFRSGRPTSVRDDMSLVGILSTQIVVGELRG